MQTRKLAAIWAALALTVSGVIPAIAAPPTNTNIQIGTSTTNSVPNISIDVSTVSSSVSVTVRIAGTAQAPNASSTNAGSYILGGAILVRSPGARSASLHSMSTTYNAFTKNLVADTGVQSVQGAPQMWQGTTNLSSPSAASINYPQNSLGSSSGGEVAMCFPFRFYHANNSFEDIWYCTQTFVWPEAPDTTAPTMLTGGAFAPTIQADGTTLRIRFSEGMSAANAPTGFVLKRNGVDVTMTPGNISLGGMSLDFTLATTVNANDGGTFTLFYTQGTVADDAATPNLLANFSAVSVTNGSTAGTSGSSRPAPARYDGPEIMAVDNFRPIVSGGKLTFTGKNLAAVISATIGDKPVALSFDVKTGLTVTTPAGLAPGKYDLVMQSSFGKLTHLNAVTIKAPTPTKTINFKGSGEYLNETQVTELVAFNTGLNSEYEKVRCIVNAADPEVAKAIAVRVCAHVARGEARNVEVIQDVRSTFKGSGFWVRVYAAG